MGNTLAVWTDRAGAEQGKINHFLSTAKTTIYFLVPRECIENILDALANALQSPCFSFFFLYSLVLSPFPFLILFFPSVPAHSSVIVVAVKRNLPCTVHFGFLLSTCGLQRMEAEVLSSWRFWPWLQESIWKVVAFSDVTVFCSA